MDNLEHLKQFIDSFTDWTGKIIAWATLITVLITFLVVILRYGTTHGYSIALQESILYFHALVFMAGAAYTLKHNEHVRVDIFYQKLSPKGQAWVNLFGIFVLLLPFCIFIFWVSIDYVFVSWDVLEGSREAGGLPLVYILKTFILILPFLLFLQALSQVIQAVTTLLNKEHN